MEEHRGLVAGAGAVLQPRRDGDGALAVEQSLRQLDVRRRRTRRAAGERQGVALDRRLAQCRKTGVTRIRLVMDGDEIGVVLVEPAGAATSAPSALNP